MPDNDPDNSWETEEEETVAKETREKFDALYVDDELVEDLPPAAGSLYAEVIGKLIELSDNGGGWLGVSTGGREPNSVQTGLQGAARTLGVKIKTRTRTEDSEKKVYVALRDNDETEEAEEE